MKEIRIKDESIKLGQAMKLCGVVSSGVEAKIMIQQELVTVNGEICVSRGKKLYPGDQFQYQGDLYIIVS